MMASPARDTTTDAPELLDGRYVLGERVGRGGTGAVRRAHDRVLQREVAVKLLHPVHRDDAQHRARLREEARLAGALQHPGIARVFDYGEAGPGGRRPYIVMELVEGTPLSRVLAERGTLSPEETLGLLGQAAVALHVAHRAGIVHRDLKPGNMIVTESGRLALVDFGIARSSEGQDLTAPGTVVGTADYISPEQARGHAAEPRSDLYSLGMVAYECLTGRRPFRRDTVVATALAHLREPLPPLPEDVPDPVRELIDAMLAKRIEDRPADATAVVVATSACAPGELPALQTAAAGAGIARAVSGPPSGGGRPAWPVPGRMRRGSRGPGRQTPGRRWGSPGPPP